MAVATDRLQQLEERILRLDARKAKVAPGQSGLDFTAAAGKACGQGHIAADLTCHKGGGGAPKAQGQGSGRQQLVAQLEGYGVKLTPEELDEIDDGDLEGMLQAEEVKAGKRKPREELTAFTAATSKQKADLARQQQKAAAAAGDQQGELAWKQEERTVERQRVQAAISTSQQSQQSLFGVTEYDETLPLFRRDSDPTSVLLNAVIGEQLEGARVLDWEVHEKRGLHTGRVEAEGLVYRFRTDGQDVAYRPAWDGLNEREWEARSEGFLQARDPAARVDFKRVRFEQKVSKRKCSVGYSCGRSCIAMAKECRVTPSSAIGKQRLRQLQALAKEGGPQYERLAAEVAAGRHAEAVRLKEERNVGQLKKLLQDPKVAEMVRTGKVPEAGAGAQEPIKPGKVRDMSPDGIEVDAARFQYKVNASSTGEVGSLSGVQKWDPNLAGVISVWQDPADGKTYVVNGHNRLALAKRLGAEEVTVRYLDAPDAQHARAIGAMQNIAEGAGTEIDAAKFFRDTGISSAEQVKASGLPLQSGKAAKGLALQALPDGLFQAVVQGDLSVNRGAIIGGSGLSPEKQAAVYQVVKANSKMTDSTLQEYVAAAAASERAKQGTLDVFGNEEEEDNLLERSRLAASLKSKLSREKRLFGLVSKSKAAEQLEAKAGNQINTGESAKVSQEAARVLQVFDDLKNATGPISDALNAAARRIKGGESEAKVRAELEGEVIRGVEEELRRLGLSSAPARTNTEELGASMFDSTAARLDAIEERVVRLDKNCTKGKACGNSCVPATRNCRTPGAAPAAQQAPAAKGEAPAAAPSKSPSKSPGKSKPAAAKAPAPKVAAPDPAAEMQAAAREAGKTIAQQAAGLKINMERSASQEHKVADDEYKEKTKEVLRAYTAMNYREIKARQSQRMQSVGLEIDAYGKSIAKPNKFGPYNEEGLDWSIDLIERHIARTPKYDGPVTRGIKLDTQAEALRLIEQLSAGGVVTGSMESWSAANSVVESFAGRHGEKYNTAPVSVVLKQRNQYGAAINEVSAMWGEQEVLQPAGIRYRVLSVTERRIPARKRKGSRKRPRDLWQYDVEVEAIGYDPMPRRVVMDSARLDSLEGRLARLDARRAKEAPGQMGLDLSGGAGKPCGEGHIAAGYTCHKGSVLPAALEKSLKRSIPPGAMQQMAAAGDPDFKRGTERHTRTGKPAGFDHWLNYEGEITMGLEDQKKLVGELEAAGWKVHTYGPSVPQRQGQTYASHERKLPGDRGLVHDQVVIKGDKVRLLRAHQFQSATMPYLAKDVEKVGELEPVEGQGNSEFYRVKGSDRFVVRHRSPNPRSHPDVARELEGKEAVQETWTAAQRDKVFQYQFGQSMVREVTRGMKPKQPLKLDSLEARLEALEARAHG